MDTKIISETSYRRQLDAVLRSLESRVVDLNARHMIIVPGQVTLTAETALCERLGGAFDVSVMTFNRLFKKYVPDTRAYLSAHGGVMLIKKLLAENPGLKCFTKSSAKKGFPRLLYDTISMLIACDVPPAAARGLRGKGGDLRLLYEKYLGATSEKYTDGGGRLKLLKKFLETDRFITNAHIHICCFDDIPPLMRAVIRVMEKRALSVTEYTLAPHERPSVGDIELYCAPGKVLVAKAAASRIASLIKSGEPCGNFCVVTADGKADEIKRIFDENGIPYVSPESEKLSRHPLGQFIGAALNARLKGFRPSDVIKLSKNIYSGVAKADSDCFERYVTRYGINYKLFFKPFEPRGKQTAEDGELHAAAERARKKLEPLIGGDEGGFYKTVTRLLIAAAAHKPDGLKDADEGRADAADAAGELCRLTRELIGDGNFVLASEAFIEGMDGVELSVSPTRRGGVEIGDEGAFRCRSFKYVFVLDFDYDNHPRVRADSSLLSDDDIVSLRSASLTVGPLTREVNAGQTQEFLQLISGAEKLFFGYTQKAGNYLGSLTAEADIRSITESGYDAESAELQFSKNADALIKLCPTRSFMLEEYRTAQAAAASGYDAPMYMPYLAEAVGADAERFEPKPAGAIGVLGEIALPRGTTSVSRIEMYASCPMRHFFSYGLNAKPYETGELMSADIGNILHKAAELYVDAGAPNPDGLAEKLLTGALEYYLQKNGVEYDKKYIPMLLKETELLTAEIHRHLSAGGYTPLAAEKEFTYKDVIEIGGNRITLTGKIDRVDICGNMCRVVDYKTGRAKFSLTEIYSGVKLQLMIYLGHMLGEGYEPGGAYYFPLAADWESGEITMDGVTECSEESVAAADAGAAERGSSTVINAKISRGKFTVKNGYPAEKIRMLTDYARREAEQALVEISEGYISPSPYDVSLCRYCDYRVCCGYEGEGRETPKVKL